ncbi:MAG: alpha/beta hydrolase [Bacteroidetes bacterium]|nr:alpha/beta hydrolase [Bacteroidota bacterium]
MNIPHNLSPPSKFWFAVEGRAVIEALSVLINKDILDKAPKGNGDPVMVLPGLGTSDISTIPLRRWLKKLGYRVYGWELGLNKGYKPKYEDELLRHLRKIYLKYHRPVKLIGWSMGGIYAREIAKLEHHAVSQVITMGSPFAGGKSQKTNANTLYRILNGQQIRETHDRRANQLAVAPPVPTTALYSKTDGVVTWQYCIEYDEGDHLENIEVKGSHLGFGINSMTWMILADRLAQDPDNWKPFDPVRLRQSGCPVLV